MIMKTLRDGRTVPHDSEEWKAECLAKFNEDHPDSIHHAHLANLKTIPGSKDRAAYLDGVKRKEGDEAAKRLGEAYGAWWTEKKAAKP